MIDFEGSLRRVVADLDAEGLRYALVGGVAVAALTRPRLTWDCDFAVWVDSDARAEQVVLAMTRRNYIPGAVIEQAVTGRLATVRLTAPDPDGTTVDLLFASCGVEPEIVAGAEVTEIAPGLSMPVARPGHLIAMKLLARDDRRRPLDYDDLRSLAEMAEDEDWAMAEEAVGLIEQRGFSRGRDLTAALSLLREGRLES